MPGAFRIEIKEVGVWFDVDGADTLLAAFRLASKYASLHGENRVQITTPDGEIY